MSDEPNTTALAAPAGMAELATLTDEQIAQREAAIMRAAEAKKRFVLAALTLAYPKDFQDFGGKPYLSGDGAERLIGVGITVSEPVFTKERVGGHWFVECIVEAKWPAFGATCCEIGTCDTGDKLWNNEGERSQINQLREKFGGDEALANRALLGWVMKKARQNAVSRAVSGVMGIKGLRWEDLAKAGFTKDKGAKPVEFKSKKGAKKSTGAIETVDAAGLVKLAIGSKCNLRATLAGGAVIGEKSTRFYVAGPSGKLTVFCRGIDPIEEWVAAGIEVFFADLKVDEYQGRATYWASHPEAVTDGS